MNEVAGAVDALSAGDIARLPPAGTAEGDRLGRDGSALLARGGCALLLLSGGMATRMGGTVKALVEVTAGSSFLDLRLRERSRLGDRVGVLPPLWLMTSPATDEAIRAALGEHIAAGGVELFQQRTDVRRRPDGSVFRDREGNVSSHACGHGDVVDAVRDAGVLARFLDRGGEHVMIANIDNLGAALDDVVLGWHLAHGAPLTCEVVDAAGDRGGLPVRWNGRPVILEEFRVPAAFDRSLVKVFNTNTFTVSAQALHDHDAPWTWFSVAKEVDGEPVVQRERLLGELTSHLDTRFLHVDRDGHSSRFLPVKDADELERRRPAVRAVLASRGVL